MNNLSLFLASSLIWGSTWLVITYQYGNVAPEVSVFYRFAIATLMLLVWCLARGLSLRYSKREHLYIGLQGVFNFALNYLLIYHAEKYVSSGLVAVMFSTMVAINIIGSRLVFHTPLTANVIVGAGLGLAGIALMFWPEVAQLSGNDNAAMGLWLALAGAASASVGNLFAMRNQRMGLPVMQTNLWGMFYGTVFIGIVCLLLRRDFNFDFSAKYVGSLLYLALFGSVLAFTAYMTLIGRIGASKASYTSVLIPVIALLLSTYFEKFQWHGLTLLGIALCFAGNFIILARKK